MFVSRADLAGDTGHGTRDTGHALIKLHSSVRPRPGQKLIKITGTDFFNAIIDQKDRYLYMVRVSIQMESVPTLNSDLLSELVQVCQNVSGQILFQRH